MRVYSINNIEFMVNYSPNNFNNVRTIYDYELLINEKYDLCFSRNSLKSPINIGWVP